MKRCTTEKYRFTDDELKTLILLYVQDKTGQATPVDITEVSLEHEPCGIAISWNWLKEMDL